MNLQNILTEIEKVDGEVFDRLEHVSRRHMFSVFAKKASAAVAAPLLVGTAVKQAYAQTGLQPIVIDVLNFALTLEYIEYGYYQAGMNAPGLITGQDRILFGQLTKHEFQHVVLLKAVLDGSAIAQPKLDLTAKGRYNDILTNMKTFATVSMVLEDTGVRAYKGQATNLMVNKPILEAALRIHSVEARHAARVRQFNGLKGWIVSDMGGSLPNYAKEGIWIENGIDLADQTKKSQFTVSESFDEPLSKEEVLPIAALFLA